VQGFLPTMAATEPWPPNIALATRLRHPLGVVVVATGDEPPLPFADAAFDLVASRHPAALWWDEVARVLKPGGSYFAQHVGAIYLRRLIEYFVGPQPRALIRGS
jgi:SAM-dependent methyltransferase